MTLPTAAAVFPGAGEMAERCRALDWAATSLGPVEAWPESLRTAAGLVMASAFATILCWGPDLVQVYNDGYVPITGAKHPWALGRPTREVWPEVWHLNGPLFARAQAGETVHVVEAPYALRRRGPDEPPDDTFFTLSFSPVRDGAGAVGGVVVAALEVTEQVAGRAAHAARERLLEALAVERARLAAVFRQSPSFLAVLRGPADVFEFVNDAYEQLVGRGRDVVGRALFDAIPEARGQGFDEMLGRVRASGAPLVFRDLPVLLDRAPGAPREERFLDVTYLPLVEADGTHEAVIAHGTDVTEQVRARRAAEAAAAALAEANGRLQAQRAELELANHQLQEQQAELEVTNQQLQENAVELEVQAEELHAAAAQLEEQAAAAREANAAKSQFLANMSHELRTPLNAIGGYVQLLEMGLHGPVSDDQRGALGRVQAAQRRLLSLINDVLNYAKLEAGRVEYDMAAVDVHDVVADVAPLIAPLAAAKGLAFDVRLPDTPCLVWADRAKLGQVLVNLLSNAVKFTDVRPGGAPGRVAVDVTARRGGVSAAGADAVFLRVADTGRGIPREKQAAVFEPFVQVQTGYAGATEGTGLGLAISRDLARGMGGDLRVRSAPGEGATFTVALRRAAEGATLLGC